MHVKGASVGAKPEIPLRVLGGRGDCAEAEAGAPKKGEGNPSRSPGDEPASLEVPELPPHFQNTLQYLHFKGFYHY